MPDRPERMYCAQQIKIPPNLPFILKQYAKAAIRTQPYDLLYWSAAYFRAKANNTLPPVKERLEYPTTDTPSRLSPGFLKVLHKQLGGNDYVAAEILYERWLGVCLVKEALEDMLRVGDMRGKIPWLKFVAIAAGHLCDSLSKTMVLVCEVLTEEPEGGSAMIPLEVFATLYQFLARLDCGPLLPDIESIYDSVGPSSTCATSTESSQTSIDEDNKQETLKDGGISEKDSSAGLMVWPDLKPIVKEDRIQSPKYLDKDGASSDMGIEVLDDAQGPVTEIVTIYPAHPQIQSDISIPNTPSSTEAHTGAGIDGSILSRTSLKEIRSWIKIEIIPDEIILNKEHSEAAENSIFGKTASDDSKKLAVDDIDSKLNSFENLKENEILVKKSADENEDNASSNEHKIDLETPEEESVNKRKVISQNDDESNALLTQAFSSEETEFRASETVTVTHFFRDSTDDNTSKSANEIRKGVCGEQSGQLLHRDSSENTVKEAMTVFKIVAEEESSVLIDDDKQVGESSKVQSSSDKSLSERESLSSTKESPKVLRQHIPGIGPVIPETEILAVLEYLQYWAAKQHGMVMPRNINHMLCPPLDMPPATEQSNDSQSRY